jgi:transposase
MGWSGRAPACRHEKLARGAQDKEHAMSQRLNAAIAVIGIDIGKNSFHIVGHDHRGAMTRSGSTRRDWFQRSVFGLRPCEEQEHRNVGPR